MRGLYKWRFFEVMFLRIFGGLQRERGEHIIYVYIYLCVCLSLSCLCELYKYFNAGIW